MKRLIILSLSLLAINGVFSQGPCNNVKIITPLSPKPTDAIVTNTCAAFTVQWQGQPNQSFLFTAIEKDAKTNRIIDTLVNNTAANTVTITLKPGSSIRWQVEAINKIDGRDFYSYPLRGGKDYIIPACNAPVMAAVEKANALTVSPDLNSKIKVYPNPFRSALNIKFAGNTSSQKLISIFDANGKLISTQRTAENITQVNVKQLTPGTYIIKIQDSNGKVLYTGNVVKE